MAGTATEVQTGDQDFSWGLQENLNDLGRTVYLWRRWHARVLITDVEEEGLVTGESGEVSVRRVRGLSS